MPGINPRELEILDAQISAQLDLLRHSNTVNADILRLLEDMRRELIGKLEAGKLTEFGKARLNALLKDTSLTIEQYFQAAQEILSPSYAKVAQVSAQQAIVGIPEGLTATVPSNTVLQSLVSSILIEGAPSAAWWDRMSQETVFKFSNAVRHGIVQGETNEQIYKRVGEVTDLAGRNSRALVHTSIMQVASDARKATIKANEDIYKGYRHISTLDGHTTLTCVARSNLEWDLNEEPIGHSLPFIPPPVHWGCLLGDSVVSSVGDVTGVSKRWFDGNIVIIETASGRKLSCTPNHPILTNSGWVAAESLNVGGNVISNVFGKRVGFGDGDYNDVKSTIHDFTEAFLRSRQVLPVPVPVSAEDFHGDGIGSEVAVVYSDSFLFGGDYPEFLEHFKKQVFSRRCSSALGALKGLCSKLYAFACNGRAAHFVVGSFSKFLSILKGYYSHAGKLLFATIARFITFALENFSYPSDTDFKLIRNAANTNSTCKQGYNGRYADLMKDGCNSHINSTHTFDTVFSKDSMDNILIDSKLFSDGGTTYAGSVFVDDVVDVRIIKFVGHVYNLETVKGWYVANGIVTHNCRSILMGILRTFKELGIDIPEPAMGTRSSAEGQIPANTTFEEFLKRRTVEEQDAQLGHGRAQMWRDGKITLRQLVDNQGNPLTLAELIAKYE